MPNSNCLEGFKCPKCGSEERFAIEVCTVITFTDNGSEDEGADKEWQDDSYCACDDCGHAGKVKDFQIPKDEAYQDRASFYDKKTNELIVSYPQFANSDLDLIAAQKAKITFLNQYDYVIPPQDGDKVEGGGEIAPRSFTTADADRFLSFADQFLEDWQADEGRNNDGDLQTAMAAFKAIRPLLVAAPSLLKALELAQQALNATPSFWVSHDPRLNSYDVASIVDKAILLAKGKGGAA